MDLVIAPDDLRRADVRELLDAHLAFSHDVTPVGYACALGIEGLSDPAVTFCSARRRGRLVGVGALKRLDAVHAELKSMHTRADSRGQGVGRAMVEHLLDLARGEGFERVSLETGTMEAFSSARALYASVGFAPCEAFGEYQASPHNTFMSICLRG